MKGFWWIALSLTCAAPAGAVTVDAANAADVAARCERMWQAFAASGDEHGMQSVGENPDCQKANEILAKQKAAQEKKRAGDASDRNRDRTGK